MAGLATKETNHDVAAYLNTIEPAAKQEDARTLVAMMKEVSGEEPKLWGEHGMIGFGKYTYTRKGSKEELEWFQMGFAARKTKVTVYLTSAADCSACIRRRSPRSPPGFSSRARTG